MSAGLATGTAAGPVIVTGGGRGIGAATVRRLVAAGRPACFGYRSDAASADALVAELGSGAGASGPTVLAVRCDLATEAGVLTLFEACDAEFGAPTALVNNAGIVAPRSDVADMEAARIERVLALNVAGAFLCCREAVRRMSTARGGAGGVIVNVSSVAATVGSAHEYVDYAASKAAVDALTRGLALEVAAEGIRVVGVRPGIVDTDIHASGGQPDRVARVAPLVPMARAGTADEIAAAILWLLSDEAGYVTGTSLDVSGGR